MSRARALLVAAILVLALPTAAAAAPTNDLFEGATIIDPAGLPFADSLDTTDATTDAVDEEANAQCGAPVTLGSVWYSFTPTETADYLVDVGQSSFEAGVIVVSGEPGSLVVIWCGPIYIEFFGEAGTTYHIMAFSDTEGVTGGDLEIVVDRVPPPPEITIAVDPVGTISRSTGMITVGVTVTCSEPAWIDMWGDLRQRAGRFYVTGAGWGGDQCLDTVSLPFMIDPLSVNGIFVAGKATIHLYASAYRLEGARAAYPGFASAAATPGGEAYLEATIRLRFVR